MTQRSRRLIHYSKTPLTEVRSRAHADSGAGAYKTPGLWVSAEGDDDWLAWCKSERWGLDGFAYATEIVLAHDANVKCLSSAAAIDAFTAKFTPPSRPSWDHNLDWLEIRKRWRGLIIAPYCWARRLAAHTAWYYSWDCASGVIWDAEAVKELRPLPAPILPEEDRHDTEEAGSQQGARQ